MTLPEIYGVSRIGTKHQINQDRYCVATDGLGAAVLDGVSADPGVEHFVEGATRSLVGCLDSSSLAEWFDDTHLWFQRNRVRASVLVARYESGHVQYDWIGDCVAFASEDSETVQIAGWPLGQRARFMGSIGSLHAGSSCVKLEPGRAHLLGTDGLLAAPTAIAAMLASRDSSHAANCLSVPSYDDMTAVIIRRAGEWQQSR